MRTCAPTTRRSPARSAARTSPPWPPRPDADRAAPSPSDEGGCMSTTGAATEVAANLRDAFRGSLITPDDPGYDEARALYNGMVDKRPALIARCHDAAD